jgi:bifunctional DNA-binding transcriptional regulator/antitoxin component of YhaV-PrlF toxin-antitoxin module
MTVIVKDKTPLTVPDQVRRRAGFKPGDQVDFPTHGPADTMTAGEVKKVRHALKQAREGKTVPWSQIKHERGL